MKRIGTIQKTKEITSQYTFLLKKKFGQNFLIDQNILEGIIRESRLDRTWNVIEIGPGIGALTEHLCEHANHVLSYEVDSKLEVLLHENLSKYQNFTLILQDFLEANIKEDALRVFKTLDHIHLVANLPYYITTPIIFKVLEECPFIQSLTIMVQQEVANRIVASKGKEYNNLSVVIQYRAQAKKLFTVSRNCFMPAPNVESAVLQLQMIERERKAENEPFFYKLVRNAFAMRRKTLLNNLIQSYPLKKEQVLSLFEEIGISPDCRGEELSIEEFVLISNKLYKMVN